MIAKFFKSGAIHGVKYIVSSSFGNYSRVFWTLSVILSICGFFYYLHPPWMKLMFEPEILIKTYERNIKEFPWPAITVCPNIYAVSKMARFSELNVSSSKLSEKECQINYANLMWCSRRQIQDLYRNGSCSKDVLYGTNIPETILKSSLPHKELIFIPDLNQITPQKTALTGYGPCYTYNSLSYSSLFKKENIHDDFKQFQMFIDDTEDDSTWSAEKGLKLGKESKIYTQDKFRSLRIALKISPENVGNVCFEKAMRIFIHKPNEIVYSSHEYYDLNYNEYRKVRLTIKSRQTDNGLRKYPPESRKCYFENEKPLKFFKTYTKFNCELECIALKALEICGCVFYSMPRDKNMKVCNSEEAECRLKNETVSCYDTCYPACNDVSFEMTSEFSKIKDDIFEYHKISSDWSVSCALFYFHDKTVEEVQHFLSYRTQNFISDFGGLLGLFMGCSVLSWVELCFFLFLGIRSSLSNFFQKITRNETNDDTWATKSMALKLKSATQTQHPVENFGDIIVTLNAFMRETRENLQQIKRENEKISERLAKIEMEHARFDKNSIGTSIQSFI